jgi:hypothetical protein
MADKFLQSADGKGFYRETADGSYEPFQVPRDKILVDRGSVRGLELLDRASDDHSGSSDSIRDTEEYYRQRDNDSSKDFFSNPKNGKQKLKRQEAIQNQLVQMVSERVDPGPANNVEVIKDERYLEYTEMYQRAVAKGEQKHCEFQPLATYQLKVQRARPILKGEVGMIGSKILRLEAGYGEGTLIQVTKQIQKTTPSGIVYTDTVEINSEDS